MKSITFKPATTFKFAAFLMGCCAALTVAAQESGIKKAVFSKFTYKAENIVSVSPDEAKQSYLNPILPGFHPDPSICRVGKDYYLINSTFCYFPGIPIFHSTDLKHWTQIGNVLDRPSQLELPSGQRMSRGIYAPDIKYNPYNKKFYVVVTNVSNLGNFFVTCDDPKKGNWSDPVRLPKVNGIDPGIFFDEDGKAYIVHNSDPDGEPLYSGHRAIRIHEFDWKSGKTIGEGKVIINGGVDITKNPAWIEGPHLYKINGTYYLMAAEGGTGPQHSEVVFRADNPMGPYTPCPVNPILTQRGLPHDRQNAVECTGHADLVQTEAGDWYAVFLGTRNYRDGHTNIGRETFMLPVEWDKENDQPIILPKGEAVPAVVPMSEEMKELDTSGKGAWDFYAETGLWKNGKLLPQALFIRTPRTQFYEISGKGLALTARKETIESMSNPSFIGHRQTSSQFAVQASMAFTPEETGDFAGLVVFQNDQCYIRFGKTIGPDGNRVLMLRAKSLGKVKAAKVVTIPDNRKDSEVELKVESNEASDYVFSYRFKGEKEWINVGGPVDATYLSTATAGGFSGVVIGMYATCK